MATARSKGRAQAGTGLGAGACSVAVAGSARQAGPWAARGRRFFFFFFFLSASGPLWRLQWKRTEGQLGTWMSFAGGGTRMRPPNKPLKMFAKAEKMFVDAADEHGEAPACAAPWWPKRSYDAAAFSPGRKGNLVGLPAGDLLKRSSASRPAGVPIPGGCFHPPKATVLGPS